MADTPQHVAIIMDGNGRWARSRGLPRPAGHRASVKVVRRVVEECIRRDIRVPHLVRLLERELAAPARRGRAAHEAPARGAGSRGGGPARESRALEVHRRSRRARRRDYTHACCRPRRSRRATRGSCCASPSPTAAVGTSLRPAVRSPARSPPARCSPTRSTRRSIAARLALAGPAGPGSAHPHRRGAAHQQFPAVESRVCGAVLHGGAVSGFQRRGVGGGAAVLRAARATLRQDLGADRRESRCLSCASSRPASSAVCSLPACSCSIPTGRRSASALC